MRARGAGRKTSRARAIWHPVVGHSSVRKENKRSKLEGRALRTTGIENFTVLNKMIDASRFTTSNT